MAIIQPAIEILGIQINEPVTTVTDLIVSAVCFYAFFKIRKIAGKEKLHLYLTYFFFSMGISTAFGGIIGHGFMYLLSDYWVLLGWCSSIVAINLMGKAVLIYASDLINKKTWKILSWVNTAELPVFLLLTFFTLNFLFVVIYSTYGLLLFVGSFSVFIYKKTRSEGSKFFLIAVLFASIAALIYMNEWSIHTWFNYMDTGHCFMATSAFFFYKGARRMIDEG